MHFLELQDFVSESVMANRFVYVFSLNIDWGLDKAPHRMLRETPRDTGVAKYFARYMVV